MSDTNTWLDDFYEMNPDAVVEKEEKKKKKSKENSVPLELELNAMDFCNKDFYTSLTAEQQKEVSLWVLMRFMSSSQKAPEHHLMMVNDLVNHNFSNLSKHPELQWKLLSLCGTGKKQFHPWVAPPKGIKKNKVEAAILSHYPLLKDDELEMLLRLNTQEELVMFFRENGYDDKTIAELFKSTTKGD